MANPTTNYGFVLPTSTDLVTDLPADFDVALQGVDTRLKALQPGTTLGDLTYSSATANTNTRLAIGSTGNVLTVSGGVPVWSAPAGGGKILQVVYANSTTSTSIGTATFTDTTLSATITPSSASSTILIMVQQIFQNSRSAAQTSIASRILRNSTSIYSPAPSFFEQANYNIDGANSVEVMANIPMDYVDSPATTSATTYKTQARPTGTSTCVAQPNSSISSIVLLEIGA
jgi:hypothetical protein